MKTVISKDEIVKTLASGVLEIRPYPEEVIEVDPEIIKKMKIDNGYTMGILTHRKTDLISSSWKERKRDFLHANAIMYN